MAKGVERLRIIAIAGSLRKDSYNMALIRTAKEVAPKNVDVDIFNLSDIPVYNQDLESSIPESVREFKRRIRAADAVLIATPEYNRSIPGVLKNAIDWASRPYGGNSFDDKPVAVFGATGGSLIGTSAAQFALLPVFSFLNMHPLEARHLYITGVGEKVSGGVVVDQQTRELISDLVTKLAEWTVRIR